MEDNGGEVSDCKGYDYLVDAELPTAKVFIADVSYDSDHIYSDVEKRGGTPIILAIANHKQPISIDGCICPSKPDRAASTSTNVPGASLPAKKTATSYLAIVYIIAVRLWVRSMST